jgi:hypothetical protein
VNPRTRLAALFVVATLVVWHGLLQGVPHHHADTTVSQQLVTCPASHLVARETHLHDSGPPLTPHLCLACLAGSTIAALPAISEANASIPGPSGFAVDPADQHSELNVHLPLLRGPPVAV